MTSLSTLDGYFREADSWDADRIMRWRRASALAWCVALAGWICAVCSALAIVVMMPLERVDPFLIRVDSTTGVVDVVPVFAGSTDQEEPVTRYFLSHYLTICERFNSSTAESDYEECAAFHSAQRNQSWFARWAVSNPDSPLNLYKDGTSVRVEVTAISFFTRASGMADLAQVRYLKVLRPQGGAAEHYSHWIATVKYAYGAPAKDPRTRRWNPLGFRVLDLHSELEASVEPAPAPGEHHD